VLCVIVEYIHYALTSHSGEELVAGYRDAAAHLAAAPEALGWELTRCTEDPSQFVLRIEWKSAEDHLQGFRKGAHFPRFLAAIRPFIGEIAEMRHYEPTGVASA
jgi:heme-degrading monooxygenase HmoA